MAFEKSVNFYLKETTEDADIQHLTCLVIQKAWRSGYQIYVLFDTVEESTYFDDLLWTFKNDSFVPHALYSEAADSPIVIGTVADQCPQHCTAIVTRQSEALSNYHLRIMDIIGTGETAREKARDRYRFYKRAGIEPQMHKL